MKTTTPSTESQETASLNKLRSEISSDIENMQQKESNLREYEQRLRLLVEQSQHAQPASPAVLPSSAAGPAAAAAEELDASWERYRRAHALLEAARRGLCDDRLALKDREERIQQREVEASRREAWIKVREKELEAQAAERAKELEAVKNKPKGSKLSNFSVAPLLAARKLLTRNS